MEVSFIPRCIINYFSTNFFKQNEINILFSNILLILLFLVFKNSVVNFMNLLPHFCLFDKLFGLECPFCGTTRAFCEIANFNLSNAYKLNFSSLFVALYFAFQIPLRLFSLYKFKSIENVNLISRYLGNTVLIIILVNWLIKIFT